jgi:hypothetical protein
MLRPPGYAALVPCRAGMRGRFPLNGTYFQVNEVFLDDSSLSDPIQVLPCCFGFFFAPARAQRLRLPCASTPSRSVLIHTSSLLMHIVDSCMQ